jgi:hypothetical protein
MSTAIVEPKSEVTTTPAEQARITRPKNWMRIEEFLSKPEADILYDQMMDQNWTAHKENHPDDAAAIYYGLSYKMGGGPRPDEIAEIPDFLKAVANEISALTRTPINYIQCHRYGPGVPVRPHADPKGMVVPMIVVGQERTFRVGGKLPKGFKQAQRKVADHIPDEELLLQHGSFLIFNGGQTVHSMFPAAEDAQCNLNDFDWRISILFRYTTEAMRKYGPGTKCNTKGGIEQYAAAINEFRAALANGSLQQGNLWESSVPPNTALTTVEQEIFPMLHSPAEMPSDQLADKGITRPWHKYCDQSSWHEAANIFPLMPGNELQKLADDIKANGLKNPIVLLNDKVLDGRNRLLACKLAGVTPDFQPRDAEKLGSPVSWVLSQNIRRRQLTTTQRAFIAVEAEKLFAIEAKQREHNRKTTQATLPESSKGQARDQAAKALDVSPRYVQDAKAIATKSPEVAAQAKAGKVSMAEAKHATQPTPAESPKPEPAAQQTPADAVKAITAVMDKLVREMSTEDALTVYEQLGEELKQRISVECIA